MFKQITKHCVFFLIFWVMLFSLYCLSISTINDKTNENLTRSAAYLEMDPVYTNILGDAGNTTIDRYADAILLNIGFNFNKNEVLKSIAWSPYYFSPTQNENDNFLDSTCLGLKANKQYMRYWHGSLAFLLPMHMM